MPLPPELDLRGKVAVITADRRGWTSSLALALAEAGATVAIAGTPESDATTAVDEVKGQGRRALAITADLTVSEDVESMVSHVIMEFGRIDILVNNARVDFGKPFLDVTEDEWDSVMRLNVKSMFLCSQAAGRRMVEQGTGHIVNIGSGLASRGLWNAAALSASQGAIRQLTASLGLEWARRGVRVNAIGTGWMSTEPPDDDAERELLVRYIPTRRKGQLSDLAGLVVYLASDASDFVTGQMFHVDGGLIAHA
jgi:NAD(P)-dependent dehydrogenase (short-subunit alcohol dehydrogenase family)